ncbi:MAG: UDP-N-acetylmuramoyl-L-alanyl-D-glutamate--2,6-diaminopimelate ligase [Deltaproteobacteria bacterium]
MLLKDLLDGISYSLIAGSDGCEISGIAYDSRYVVPGGLFVCIEGTVTDGHQYISAACEAGAAALIVQKSVKAPPGVTVILAENSRQALALASSAWFGHPSRHLKLIGVTGTKGKTTTTYMIKAILEESGHRTGLIGTIETIVGDAHTPAKNTTPESYELQKLFRAMLDAGCDSAVMEVSSQGLMMDRVTGCDFDIGIFTNISPDHIGPNEHPNYENYLYCKTMLFKMCKLGILNIDDPGYQDMLAGSSCEILTFGLSSGADYQAADVSMLARSGWLGVSFNLTGPGGTFPVKVGVPGDFSVYNALAAIAACLPFGATPEGINRALENIRVRGRIELVPALPHFTLLIDYAHNALSLENLLRTLRAYEPPRLICLFGCGGNRDRQRRFDMGRISGQMADFSILTTDNPRNEEPESIFADIQQGINPTGGKYIIIDDRLEAIRYLIQNAQPGDVAVLAGKGHESYQEIRGIKHHMDERELVAQVLAELKA